VRLDREENRRVRVREAAGIKDQRHIEEGKAPASEGGRYKTKVSLTMAA
jgi:hypothetical protein